MYLVLRVSLVVSCNAYANSEMQLPFAKYLNLI
jgi:hypothetical protein